MSRKVTEFEGRMGPAWLQDNDGRDSVAYRLLPDEALVGARGTWRVTVDFTPEPCLIEDIKTAIANCEAREVDKVHWPNVIANFLSNKGWAFSNKGWPFARKDGK